MNIEQAKLILISVILDKMNLSPQRKNGHKVLYFSPFRKEKTPSLWVDTKANLWCDYGDTKWKGGDGIHLVRAYLDSENEGCAVKDALRWLKNMTGYVPDIKPVIDLADTPTEKTLVLRQAGALTDQKLIEYGNTRGIPKNILSQYFQQATIFNNRTQKKFVALCMRNDLKGYELRNPYFKGCIGKKYPTFIRGTDAKPQAINVFEGAFDFASVITQRNGEPMRYDSLVLHSLSNLRLGSAFIKLYGYQNCFTWMDNDKSGKEALKSWDEFCKTENGLLHVPMNKYYFPYKDVNAAHMAKLEL